MMSLREMTHKDLIDIEEIHEKFFKEEFDLPDFLRNFHAAFIIEDGHDNDFVLAGGVRPIAELVCITNKGISTKKRVIALKEATKVGMSIASYHGYDQLHCFVQGEQWTKQVKTFFFRPTRGHALVLDIGT